MDIEPAVDTEEDEVREYTICIVCHENTMNDEIKFCRCNYSVHHECLKMTLLSYAEPVASGNFVRIPCPNCNSNVIFTIRPCKNVFVTEMEIISCIYNWFCGKFVHCITVLTIQQAFTTYGLAVLYQIYGKKTATEMFLDPLGVSLCQTISFIPVIISSSGWEDILLKGLRRCSRLTVVGRVFPREYPDVKEVSLGHKSSLDAIVDGLLLPQYAQVCGILLCGSAEPGLRRFLLGAAAFLSVRGALYMYYRQIRYSYLGGIRTVANYQD